MRLLEYCEGTKRVIFSNVNFSSDTSNEVYVSPRAEEETEVSNEMFLFGTHRGQTVLPQSGCLPTLFRVSNISSEWSQTFLREYVVYFHILKHTVFTFSGTSIFLKLKIFKI